jgi:hypothetical protein
MGSTADRTAGGAPLARVGRRFLPIAASALPPIAADGDVLQLPVSAGTPVHAIQSGRVVASDAGDVTLAVEDGVHLEYEGLLPASTTVRSGDAVDAGDVIGVVAADDSGAGALRVGARRPDGSSASIAEMIVGLPDPLELYLSLPSVAPVPAPTAAVTPMAATAADPPATAADPPATAPQPSAPASESPPPPSRSAADDPRAGRVRSLAGRRNRPGRPR